MENKGDNMNLYEAIFLRKSVRSYEMEPVSAEVLQEIREFYGEIEGLNPGIKFLLQNKFFRYQQLVNLGFLHYNLLHIFITNSDVIRVCLHRHAVAQLTHWLFLKYLHIEGEFGTHLTAP